MPNNRIKDINISTETNSLYKRSFITTVITVQINKYLEEILFMKGMYVYQFYT